MSHPYSALTGAVAEQAAPRGPGEESAGAAKIEDLGVAAEDDRDDLRAAGDGMSAAVILGSRRHRARPLAPRTLGAVQGVERRLVTRWSNVPAVEREAISDRSLGRCPASGAWIGQPSSGGPPPAAGSCAVCRPRGGREPGRDGVGHSAPTGSCRCRPDEAVLRRAAASRAASRRARPGDQVPAIASRMRRPRRASARGPNWRPG